MDVVIFQVLAWKKNMIYLETFLALIKMFITNHDLWEICFHLHGFFHVFLCPQFHFSHPLLAFSNISLKMQLFNDIPKVKSALQHIILLFCIQIQS